MNDRERQADLARLIEEGPIDDEVVDSLYMHELGSLALPTGRIVACDPLASGDDTPFTRTVSPGEHPVRLSVIRVFYGGDKTREADERIAAATLWFAERPIERWEVAVWSTTDHDPTDLSEPIGYGVDSGTGCFMDVTAARTFFEMDMQESDQVMIALDMNYRNTRTWIDWTLDETTGLNAMLFSSGFGDGFYASYFGLDEDGEAVCLLTDFGCL